MIMRDPCLVSHILQITHIIDGKEVECKLAVPKDEITQNRAIRKLFVGGLGSDVSQEEFHSYFAQFGEIEDSVVMRDKLTGKPRGFGFITFSNPRSLSYALRMYDRHSIKGK